MKEVEDEDVTREMKMICLCSRRREEDEAFKVFTHKQVRKWCRQQIVSTKMRKKEKEKEKETEKGNFVIFGR